MTRFSGSCVVVPLLLSALGLQPVDADEWDPVVANDDAFLLIKPADRAGDLPVDAVAEQDALRTFIVSDNEEFHYNILGYRLDGDFFKFVPAWAPCLEDDDCTDPYADIYAIWPPPRPNPQEMAAFDSENEGWLNDLEPFSNQVITGRERVGSWARLGRLSNPGHFRLCMEDPNHRGAFAGNGACQCAFSFDEMVSYFRDQLRYMHASAEAVEPGLFEKTVTGVHINLETYVFPRTLWPLGTVPHAGDPHLDALPGVCAATGREFNRHDFDDDFAPDDRHTCGGVSGPEEPVTDFDLFLEDVEFDYPALKLALHGADLGTVEFGSLTAEAISQAFPVNPLDDAISRIDVELSRTDSTITEAPRLLWMLTKTNPDGSPDLGTHTTPRFSRSNWFPHRDFTGRGWISLYVDPNESQTLFEPEEMIALVVYVTKPLDVDTYAVDYSEATAGMPAYRMNTNGEDPPLISQVDLLVGVTINIRVWNATVLDPSAHDDWIVFQNRRVGMMMKRMNDALMPAGPYPDLRSVGLWPFAHIPSDINLYIERRELYGSDITENFHGEGTSTQLHGVQVGEIVDIEAIEAVYATRVMPTVHQVTDDKNTTESGYPDWTRIRVHNSTKWDFAVGGLAVFTTKSTPTGTEYEDWKASHYPRLRAYTAPARVFRDHYRWVNQGHIPLVATPMGLYELTSFCPTSVSGQPSERSPVDPLTRRTSGASPTTPPLTFAQEASRWERRYPPGPLAKFVALRPTGRRCSAASAEAA